MPAEFNFERVEYYPPNDLANAMYKQRILELLQNPDGELLDINDCIEAHQCLLTLKAYPELFPDNDYPALKSIADDRVKQSFATTNRLLNALGLFEIFDTVERQYIFQFWTLIVECGVYKRIDSSDFIRTLQGNPFILGDILSLRPLVKQFGNEISLVMKGAPHISAELIVSRIGSQSHRNDACILPGELSASDIDEIMFKYLAGEEPNLNHVRVLSMWPASAKNKYDPSRIVKAAATKKAAELNGSMFKGGVSTGFSYGIGVFISDEQRACKGITVDGNDFTLTFGHEWLTRHTDPGTILNNFIYVFDFVNTQGLLNAPAHKHEMHAIVESLGLHPLDEYPTGVAFGMKSAQTLIIILAYRRLLLSVGARLETAIEWFFNSYIPEEFGITGFYINMPTESATFLEKCKSIGPEIESALKSFQLLFEDGKIDPDSLRYLSVKKFSDYPSFINKKYLIEGQQFVPYAQTLFSDQSVLAYSDTYNDSDSFFDIVHDHNPSVGDFHDNFQSLITELSDRGLIQIDADERILLTERSLILRKIWNEGAISIHLFDEETQQVASSLVEEGYLSYKSSLLTPDEADYFNYMFNNASFSNAMGLRNKYDHASSLYPDPNAQEIEEDYCRLLGLMIQLVLKLNEELSLWTGKGGVENFVDWPWIDDSVESAARIIRKMKRRQM